jgi:hypothetical protein
MRIIELIENLGLQEGGNSKGTQFNSEVGLLAAMCGVDPATFDPTNPAPSFENSPFAIGEETLANIQSQAANYNAAKFNKWVTGVGPKISSSILAELEKLKLPAPTELAWVGSDNQSSVADIKFVNHPVDGISVKEAGAPTLANLTAKSLGLEGEDPDVFRAHAQAEWDNVKQYVFAKVIEIAKSQPGKLFSPIKSKYSITYMEGEIPQTNRLKAPKPATPQQPPAPPPPPAQQPFQQNPAPVASGDTTLSEEVSAGYFVINFGDGIVNEPENRIMTDLPKNAPWQRVFGDYFQGYWNKDAELKRLGGLLFSKIGQDFVSKIKLGLAEDSKLHSAVKMGDVSYFYATPKATFYVPSTTNNKGLKLFDLQYTAPKGTNQNFLATIGYEDQVPASVLIYIRYANGIFQANPTVRVQKLTNPQGLGWIKL